MAGPIRIAILANGSQARREINQVNSALGGMAKYARRGLAIAGVGGLAALAKSAVDTEREFSLTMRTIQANTNATGEEIDKMAKLAVKAGSEMGFSARESAGAMLELAKAGLETKTIMGGGLAGTLKLAAAGGTDLATASTIAANAMNAFSLAGKDMDSIAAALAGGANASTASVESLGIALSQVGPGATIAGLSLQETVATLAAFDNAGIKGSDSGTSLKTMLTRLVPATKAARMEAERLGLDFTKADGSFVSLEQIAGRLKASLGKLSAEQQTTALRIIFGSDATRAATVLMREGSAGIRKYIDATHDQAAAQKAVNARTSGTEGALKRLGAAVEKAKLRVGTELAPAVIAGADAFGDKLVPAIEGGIKAGKDIARALAPAAREISEALGHLAGEGDSAGKMFDEVFIPALEATAEAVGAVVNFIDELPGPIKEIGAEAAIAALILPRLAAGATAVGGAFTAASAGVTTFAARIAQNRAAMSYQTTLMGKGREAMVGFGGAARSVAGIGGFLALTQGATSSNKAISALSATAGGAAIGFSVGGPWGAAIGGGAGLLYGLAKATKRAEEEAFKGNTTWETYAATMDRVTGATTAATRATIAQELQQSGLLKEAARFGISKQTLVDGINGETKARNALTAILKSQQQAVEALQADPRFNEQSTIGKNLQQEATDRQNLINKIREETGEREKGTASAIELAAIANRIPEQVQTRIEAVGAALSARQIARLAVQYKLTPRQVKTVLQVSGSGASKAEVDKIKASLEQARRTAKNTNKDLGNVGKVKPNPQLKNKFSADLTALQRAVKPQIVTLNTVLAKAGDKKPNIANGPFGRGVSADLSAISGSARAKATAVGLNLGAGMYNGVSAWAGPIAAKARQIVNDAIAAANAAGDVRSPSRKTHYTGEMLGAGLERGLRVSRPKARTAGQKLMQSVLAGVDGGSDGIARSIEKVTAAIRKAITGKNQGKREAAYLKSLRDEYAALRRNGRAQDAVAAKLEKARDRLKELTDQYNDYARAIRDTIKATGDVTQLGRQEDGTVSVTSLLNELRNKVAAAQRFSLLIQQLAQQGLSQTSIQQMLDAGPEAALATAEAIASGGASAIAEINALQKQLAATGDQLSGSMADRYYGAGVQAAQGIVRGLEAEAKRLDRAAVRLANALVRAVKKALGIRSPSRVFAGIGDNVTKGLVIGLDDTYVKRSGAVLASSLEKGFGTPALKAMASQGGLASGDPPVARIHLTAEQLDRLSRGKELQADLDYARSNGVRGVTF